MSSLAAPAERPPAAGRAALPLGLSRGRALGLGLGAALAAVAFGARGGLQLGHATVVELALVLAAAVAGVCSLFFAPAWRRAWGGVTLGLFAALAALTALSTAWSVEPSITWVEANRTVAYLAAFVVGLALVRLVPERWEALLGAVLLACTLVCGYALATKVLPDQLSPDEVFTRVRAPFGYWNAVGLMGALGVPACLWLGSRRHDHPALNAAAYPILGLLLVTMTLAYSRGALVAAALGAAGWFALVPRRLRAVAVLACASAGAGLVVAWTFARAPLTQDRMPLGLRMVAGHQLGVALALMVLGLLVAGLAVGFLAAERPLVGRARRSAGSAVAGILALIPAVVVVALALSPGGLTGQVSSGWRSLTDPNAKVPPNVPGRLTATGSVRARYYRDGLAIWRDHPVLGTGAGGYETARAHYRRDTIEIEHAHGWAIQTLSDLGLVGLAVSLALGGAWLWTARRATGAWPRGRPDAQRHTPERIGMTTLAATVVVFAVHSLIDWTWFVPGATVLACLAAGWVAGRGPVWEAPVRRETAATMRWRAAAAVALVAVALVSAWAVWQPLRSQQASNRALVLLERGDLVAARSQAAAARRRNPLSIDPLVTGARIEAARGRPAGALADLRAATRLQPANPRSWLALADYELTTAQDLRAALVAAGHALYLDPRSPHAQSTLLAARRRLGAPFAATPRPAPARAPQRPARP